MALPCSLDRTRTVAMSALALTAGTSFGIYFLDASPQADRPPARVHVAPPPRPRVATSEFASHSFPPVFIEDRPELKCEIPVKNDTAKVVEFENVTGSCGCGEAHLGAMRLEPGQETTLSVAIDLRGRTGSQRFTYRLNRKNELTWIREVLVEVCERVKFVGGTVHFGVVEPKSISVRRSVFQVCALPGGELPEIGDVTCLNDCLSVKVGDGRIRETSSGVRYRTHSVELTLAAPQHAGLTFAKVTASAIGPTERRQAHLDVDWNVRSLIVVAPETAFFGSLGSADSRTERRIIVRRADGKPIRVLAVESDSAVCRVSIAPKVTPGEDTLILVLGTANLGDAIWGTITVQTDHPQQPGFKIPYSATP